MFLRIILPGQREERRTLEGDGGRGRCVTAICLALGEMRRTVYSAEEDAQRQEFSMIGTRLTTISTFVRETYSPPRNLIKSFFRSKSQGERDEDEDKRERERERETDR